MEKENIFITKLKLVFAFVLFGITGILKSFIPLGARSIVFYRALIGALFIIIFSMIIKRKYDLKKIKDNLLLIIFSGMSMGFCWALWFMSMEVTSVSVATICYNTAPIFMVIMSPILFKEKLTIKSILCITLSMIGIVLVSDIINVGFNISELKGVLYGLISAIFYALVVCLSKSMKDISAYDKVTCQFITVAIIFFFIVFFNKNDSFAFGTTDNLPLAIFSFLLITILITGYLYVIYYDCIDRLPAQTIAILTYIDPLVAVVLSILILHESLSLLKAIGALLILFSSIISELGNKNK